MGDALLRHEQERGSAATPAGATRPSLPDDEGFLLGVVAVERNLLTPPQAMECLRELDQARARGEAVTLEQILRRKNWITVEAVLALLQGDAAAGSEASPMRRRYEIRDRAGEGATSVVYRAWDRELGRPVALKLFREIAGFSEVARERFRREVHAAASLSHPNVVTVHDAGSDGGRLYLVMELVDGRPLAARMEEGKTPPQDLLRILAKAARGVAAAHQHGIVHRDLKPANILVTSSGDPKVGDFGLAHLTHSDTDLTRTGATLGTPQYMAPEQVQGRSKEVTPRTDVYALGAILYELLTGQPPHEEPDVVELYRRILNVDPVLPKKLRPSIAADAQTVCLKALEKDPLHRYADAGEFADDLERFLSGEAVRARPGGALSQLWKKLARRRIAVAIVALVVAVVVGAAATIVRTRQAFAEYQAAYEQGGQSWSKAVQMVRGEAFDKAPVQDLLQKAIASYRQSARAYPERTEPWLKIAHCQLLLERGDLAEEAWREVLTRDPGSFAARYERGKYYLGIYASLRRTPEMLLSDGRIRLGRLPQESPEAASWRLKGEEDLRKAKEVKTAEPTELGYLEGLLAYGEGHYDAAGKSLSAYAAANPWDAPALALIGSAFYLAKDFETAIRHLSQALRLEPRAAWYKARGDARCCLGKLVGALADYDACLQLQPQDVEVLCNRAVVLQALGRVEEAELAAGRAIELRPNLARAFNTRGLIRATRRNMDGALQDFQEAAFYDVTSAEAYNNLANVQATLQDLDQAIRNYDIALSLDPDYAVAFYNRGLALETKGLPDKAAENYRASLEREPLNPDPRYKLAQYLHEAGKRDEAIVQLRKAIEAGSDAWPRKGAAEQLLRQWTGN